MFAVVIEHPSVIARYCLAMPSPSFAFESEVANLFRAQGARVRQDVSMAGHQIDMIVISTSEGGEASSRQIVECKPQASVVGSEQVRAFARVAEKLIQRGFADSAAIVAESGFTDRARQISASNGIALFRPKDLLDRGRGQTRRAAHPTIQDDELRSLGLKVAPPSKRIFVALPFTPDGDDLYVYGMQPAAEEAGYSLVRGDTSGSRDVMSYVREQITLSALVIADSTAGNPNVFYELGLADGLGKYVLLVARRGAKLPFDVQGRGHILYKNIGDLHRKLTENLKRAAWE